MQPEYKITEKLINFRFINYGWIEVLGTEHDTENKDLYISLLIKTEGLPLGFSLPSNGNLGSFIPASYNSIFSSAEPKENKIIIPLYQVYVNGKPLKFETVDLDDPLDDEFKELVDGMGYNLSNSYDIARCFFYGQFSLNGVIENHLIKDDPFYKQLFDNQNHPEDDGWLYQKIFSEIFTYFIFNHHKFPKVTNLVQSRKHCTNCKNILIDKCTHKPTSKGVIFNTNNGVLVKFHDLEKEGVEVKAMMEKLFA